MRVFQTFKNRLCVLSAWLDKPIRSVCSRVAWEATKDYKRAKGYCWSSGRLSGHFVWKTFGYFESINSCLIDGKYFAWSLWLNKINTERIKINIEKVKINIERIGWLLNNKVSTDNRFILVQVMFTVHGNKNIILFLL